MKNIHMNDMPLHAYIRDSLDNAKANGDDEFLSRNTLLTKQQVRSDYHLRNITSGDAIRVLQFHHGMSYMEAMRFLGMVH